MSKNNIIGGMPKKTKGVILALLSSSIFGLIPFFSIPLINEGIGIPTILFYRFLFSSLIMGGVCLIRKEKINVSSGTLRKLLLLSIFFAATSLGLIASYSHIPSGIATTIHYLFPVFVAVVMMLFYKERKSFPILLLSLLALLGVGFLCWTNGGNLNVPGVVYALITVVTYGIYIVGADKFGFAKISSSVITFYVLSFGVVLFLIYALFTTGIESVTAPKSWCFLVFLAFLPTVVADFALILSIKYAGASVSAVLGVMEPVVAFAVGVLFLSEPFSYQSLLGFLLVLLAVTLVVYISVRKENNA